MLPSIACLELIKRYEGLRLVAYKDLAGNFTIGYGHRITGQEMVHSVLDAEVLLESDLDKVATAVSEMLKVDIKQHQFDALCSLAFNIGPEHLKLSTLLYKVNAAEFDAAAEEFLKWDHVHGAVIPGLLNRRKAERELFLNRKERIA